MHHTDIYTFRVVQKACKYIGAPSRVCPQPTWIPLVSRTRIAFFPHWDLFLFLTMTTLLLLHSCYSKSTPNRLGLLCLILYPLISNFLQLSWCLPSISKSARELARVGASRHNLELLANMCNIPSLGYHYINYLTFCWLRCWNERCISWPQCCIKLLQWPLVSFLHGFIILRKLKTTNLADIVLLQLQMMCSQKNGYKKCNKIRKIMKIIM